MVEFDRSRTKENLMRAFAGESLARNRYTIAAEIALKQKQYAISEIFKFTADQERAHAKVFYDFLKECSGENIYIDGAYPVDQSDCLVDLLQAAAHNEYEEHDRVYPEFAKTAGEEGYQQIAAAFTMIARVEQDHGDRFARIGRLLNAGAWHERQEPVTWFCLNCGFTCEGTIVPAACPVCHADQGYFVEKKEGYLY